MVSVVVDMKTVVCVEKTWSGSMSRARVLRMMVVFATKGGEEELWTMSRDPIKRWNARRWRKSHH